MASSISISGSGSGGSAAAVATAVSPYDKSPLIKAAFPNEMPKELIALISDYANEILGGLYGVDAWRQWKQIEILDHVPPAPQGALSKKTQPATDLSKEAPPIPPDSSHTAAADPACSWENDPNRGDRVLLYIPRRIRFNGQEQDLTLSALLKTSSREFSYFNSKIVDQFGNDTLEGWVFLDKAVLPESRGKKDEALVEARGCSKMHPIEAITLNLMTFTFTNVRLFGQSPLTYTMCNRKIDEAYPVVVGGFGSNGLCVDEFSFDYFRNCGAACALRPFDC